MKYYVNKNAQSNGNHEVHISGCSFLPSIENRKDLGEFSNCNDAVKKAKVTYKQVNGCYYCCNSCHTN